MSHDQKSDGITYGIQNVSIKLKIIQISAKSLSVLLYNHPVPSGRYVLCYSLCQQFSFDFTVVGSKKSYGNAKSHQLE